MSGNVDLLSLINSSERLLSRDVASARKFQKALTDLFYADANMETIFPTRIDRFSEIVDTTPCEAMNKISKEIYDQNIANIKVCLLTETITYYSHESGSFECVSTSKTAEIEDGTLMIFIDSLAASETFTAHTVFKLLELHTKIVMEFDAFDVNVQLVSDPLKIASKLGLRSCYLFPFLKIYFKDRE